MAQGALFVGWGSIIPGREKAAATSLQNAMQLCIRYQQEGKIESFEPVLLEPHGGDLGGYVLVKGDKEAIAQLRVDDEFVRAIIGVQLVHSHVGVVGAYADEALQSVLTMWDEEEDKLP